MEPNQQAKLGFSLESIRDYLLNEGGKVEYHKLIKHFRHALADPNNQGECGKRFLFLFHKSIFQNITVQIIYSYKMSHFECLSARYQITYSCNQLCHLFCLHLFFHFILFSSFNSHRSSSVVQRSREQSGDRF